MNIPFPPFEPDRSPYNPNAAPVVLNALPHSEGWRPMPSLQEISTALASECRGAWSFQKNDGSWVTFAWTTTKAYKFNPTDNTWTDVTRTSGGDYAVPLNNQVVARKFGPYVIAANGVDVLQVFDIEGATTNFSALGGNPPIARGLEVIGDFLVAYDISGNRGRLQWCEINNVSGWTVGQNLSDYNDIPDLGQIQYIVPTTTGGIICCRDGFMTMSFALETTWVFTFSLIHKARGVAAPYSVVPIGPADFIYYSHEGWYRGDAPIGGERIDRWFFSFSSSPDLIKMQSALDPYAKVAWIRFKGKDSKSYLLGYNFMLDRWCLADNQFQAMMKVGSPVITNDGMDAFFATIDDIDVPYDSTFWAGGSPAFGGINNDRKLAYQAASSAQATFETSLISVNGKDRVMVNSGRAITDNINFTSEIATADYHGGPLEWRTPVTPSPRSKQLPYRADGRLHKVRVTVPAGAAWTYMQGVDIDGGPGGSL